MSPFDDTDDTAGVVVVARLIDRLISDANRIDRNCAAGLCLTDCNL
jgi:hypothetical protein